jgi:hypothetical protein
MLHLVLPKGGAMHPEIELEDDEALSAEFVLTEEEIIDEFKEQCTAAVGQLELPQGLQIAAGAFCRMEQRISQRQRQSAREVMREYG